MPREKGPRADAHDLAFPAYSPDEMRQTYPTHIGLTKREFFAAKALQGIRASGDDQVPEQAAKDAVKDAEALLHELNRTNPHIE